MIGRLPLRLRLTVAFAAAMAVVLAALGFVLHARFESDLTRSIDMELRSRAQVIDAALRRGGSSVIHGGGSLIDPDEAFAQVLTSNGAIVDSSPAVAGHAMVPAAALRPRADWPLSLTTRVAGVDDPVRLLVAPTDTGVETVYVVVGSTLGDRNEALARLTVLLVLFGAVALAALSTAGWLLAGAALRPVERMRAEAGAISVSELDRRLHLPSADDELRRLGSTLNSMLERLEEAFRREGRFLDQASHELRTPLAVLKMELELAARSEDPEEMARALAEASSEADRLARLAEDLLVLSRLRGGRLPVRRTPTDVADLVRRACEAHRVRAAAAGSVIHVEGDDPVVASVDPSRVRQAVEDLLDNALRHAPGSMVEVTTERAGDTLQISVRDHGPGFADELLSAPPEPFAHGGDGGAGMGLAIVRAIAEAHGGGVSLQNEPDGGARVVVTFEVDAAPREPEEAAIGASAT